jgi:hypothetical protein
MAAVEAAAAVLAACAQPSPQQVAVGRLKRRCLRELATTTRLPLVLVVLAVALARVVVQEETARFQQLRQAVGEVGVLKASLQEMVLTVVRVAERLLTSLQHPVRVPQIKVMREARLTETMQAVEVVLGR